MKHSNRFLIKSSIWSLGSFGVSQGLRFATNVVLTHLLAPELFGIMGIVYSLRTGIELISDVGIGQNIVHNPDADKPDFYNTAWTLQVIRSVALWLIFATAAIPIAHFYETPALALIVPVVGLMFVLSALQSIAVQLLRKRMQYVRLNAFDAVMDMFSSFAFIAIAFIKPDIWALVLGGLFASAARTIASHFLIADVRLKFQINRRYVGHIFSFGKWIFLSSTVYFLSLDFDRLYYAKVAGLHMLGIYGIARTIAELVNTMIVRWSNYIVFPLIAASQTMPRAELRSLLSMKRFTFLLLGATGIALMVTFADIVIGLLYDQRYRAAGWMAPILLLGTWFRMISSLNESTLLGLGRPFYSALANGSRFMWLLLGIPAGYAQFSTLGVVVVLATSDIGRYIAILVGQIRERFSYAGQDVLGTAILFALIGLFEWLRWSLGFGLSFSGVPIGAL